MLYNIYSKEYLCLRILSKNIMKALVITLVCLALALFLRIANDFSHKKRVQSTSASIDAQGLGHYKDLID